MLIAYLSMPCSNSAKLPLNIGHGWRIASHRKQWDAITYPFPNLMLNRLLTRGLCCQISPPFGIHFLSRFLALILNSTHRCVLCHHVALAARRCVLWHWKSHWNLWIIFYDWKIIMKKMSYGGIFLSYRDWSIKLMTASRAAFMVCMWFLFHKIL